MLIQPVKNSPVSSVLFQYMYQKARRKPRSASWNHNIIFQFHTPFIGGIFFGGTSYAFRRHTSRVSRGIHYNRRGGIKHVRGDHMVPYNNFFSSARYLYSITPMPLYYLFDYREIFTNKMKYNTHSSPSTHIIQIY